MVRRALYLHFHPEIDNQALAENGSRTKRRDEIIPSLGVESLPGYPPTNFIFLLLVDAEHRSLPEDPPAPNLLVKRTPRPIALVKATPKGEK